MLIKWQEELSTGNNEIDCLHEELFSKVTRLMNAARNRDCEEYLGQFLWFLQRYIRKHFQTEEHLQRTLGFYGYKAHKEQHLHFYEKVRKIVKQYEIEGESTVLIVTVINMMAEWFKSHINKYDREVSEFLREVC